MCDWGGAWYCPDCDDHFNISCSNVPWLEITYCPNCGAASLKWEDDEEEENDE